MLQKFAAALAGLLLIVAPSALAQSGWVISEAAGQVTVVVEGRSVRAQRGTIIAPGATLSTGAGARAVVVRERDFMTVAPNSRVRIPNVAEKKGLLEVFQDWGNAVFQVEKQKAPHFGVRTPYLAAVVKGTTFSVTVTPQGASLQVVEGLVETSTLDGGAMDMIRPGIVATVASGDPLRLTVQGSETRTIDSPQRVAPEGAAAAPAVGSAVPSGEATAEAEQPSTEQIVSAPIMAAPVDLGTATGGMVSGSATAALAQVDQRDQAPANGQQGSATSDDASADEVGAAKVQAGGNAGQSAGAALALNNPNANSNSSNGAALDNGNAGGNGNGNGQGNGSGNAGGNGNGNGQGNGNGNAGGNGNGNGQGNGNGNAGGNGNGNGQGNGNGDTGGNGNGQGNGNGNAGGNGNGNGQGNGSGNAGGNGNGNGQGNGNGNAGGNGNGNGQGSGNGNAGGNGNGNGQGSGNGSAGGNGNGNGQGNGNGNGN